MLAFGHRPQRLPYRGLVRAYFLLLVAYGERQPFDLEVSVRDLGLRDFNLARKLLGFERELVDSRLEGILLRPELVKLFLVCRYVRLQFGYLRVMRLYFFL